MRACSLVADTIADVLIVIAALTIGYYLFVDLKRLVLWRVRRRLTLSYIFIGFVPALLIITFFVLSVMLLFFNVSAYSVRMQMTAFQEQARFLAQSAAVEVAAGATPAEIQRALRTRFASAVLRYPLVSYAVVPSGRACGDDQSDDPPRRTDRARPDEPRHRRDVAASGGSGRRCRRGCRATGSRC